MDYHMAVIVPTTDSLEVLETVVQKQREN